MAIDFSDLEVSTPAPKTKFDFSDLKTSSSPKRRIDFSDLETPPRGGIDFSDLKTPLQSSDDFSIRSGSPVPHISAETPSDLTIENLKASAGRAWDVVSVPGQMSPPMQPRVDPSRFSVTSPTDTGNTPAEVQGMTPTGAIIAGIPKTVAEIGAEVAASSLDPASLLLMGAGKAVAPALPKIAAVTDALTTKHTPALKKFFTYRFGVDGKFLELDDVRVKAIGDAIDRAAELGKSLSDDLTKEQQLRLGDILKGSPSTSEVEAPLRALATNARGTLDAMESKAVDLGLLPKEAILKRAATGEKYVPRLYRVFENPKKYGIENADLPVVQDMGAAQSVAFSELSETEAKRIAELIRKEKGSGTSTKVKIGGERFKQRQDLSEEYRTALGEIKEPAYPVAKGVTQVGRDIANAEFFKDVAANSDWVSETAKAGYKQMPSDPRKYGAIAGKYVKQNLAEDMEHTFRAKGPWQKGYEDLLSKYKFGKVILNPATHFRNIMSNSIMLDAAGIDLHKQPKLLMRAATELTQKGKYFQEVKTQTNLLGNEYFGGEISRFKESLFSTADDGLLERAVNTTRKLANDAGDIYQAEEQTFKMAQYIYGRDHGFSIKQAAAEAEKWGFNYNKVSPFVEALRKMPLGSPFLTYSAKAAPRLIESAVKNPMRLYKYDLLFNAIENHSQEKLGLSDADMKVIKETSRGQTVVLPVRDEAGNPLVLDVAYNVPWGSLTTSEDNVMGIPGGPLKSLLEVWPFNKSTYKASKTQSGEIVSATDNAREATIKRADYVLKSLLPSWTPGLPKDNSWFKGGYSFEKLAAAIEKRPDYFGRVNNLGLVALSTLAGIKINPVDVEQKKAFQALEKQKLIQQLKVNTGKILRHPGISEDYKEKIKNELDAKIANILELEKEKFTPKIETIKQTILPKEKEDRGLFGLPKGNLSATVLPSPYREANNLPPLSRDVVAYRAGFEKYLNGDLEGAEELFRIALRINPKRKEAERALERLSFKRNKGRNK